MNRRRRRRSRRRVNRNPFGALRGVLSRDMLMLAGGAVGAGFLNNLILNSDVVKGWNLPGRGTAIGDAAYRLLIPVGGAFALRRFGGRQFDSLAKGLIIGGLTNAISEAVDYMRTSVAGTGEYFPSLYQSRTPSRALPVSATPGYSASNLFAMNGIYDGERAFKTDAWAN